MVLILLHVIVLLLLWNHDSFDTRTCVSFFTSLLTNTWNIECKVSFYFSFRVLYTYKNGLNVEWQMNLTSFYMMMFIDTRVNIMMIDGWTTEWSHQYFIFTIKMSWDYSNLATYRFYRNTSIYISSSWQKSDLWILQKRPPNMN